MYNNFWHELYHYGIKGQKWGVRRYQNADGTYTSIGKRRRNGLYRKSDIDNIYGSLSPSDKKLAGDEPNAKEWLSKDSTSYLAKRFIAKSNGKPVGALDIYEDDQNLFGMAVFMASEARGTGKATELAIKGRKWIDNNPDIMKNARVTWWVKPENMPSKKIAEKAGFKLNKKDSDKKWELYEYYKK